MFSNHLLFLAFHPLFYLVIQKSFIILLLAFSDSGSSVRAALFPVILLCNYSLLHTYTQYITRSAWVGFIAGDVLTGPLDYLEKLLISQWSFEQNGPRKRIRVRTQEISGEVRYSIKGKGAGTRMAISPLSKTDNSRTHVLSSTWKRLRFGTWVAISNRYIASPYQARNTPHYSSTNPNYVPSKGAYLLRRGTVFLTCCLLTDLLLLGNQPTLNPVVYADKHVSFLPRLLNRQLPIKEVFTRISTTIGFWVGAYIMIQGYYSATGFLAVALGFSSPKTLRPIFGSPKDAYTIRRFWGLFWHQLTRKKFTIIASYLTYPLLRPLHLSTQYHDILSRYIRLVFTFLISGLLHQIIEVAQGLLWEESGAVEFFLLMAVGIIVEDVFIWEWKRVVKRKGNIEVENMQGGANWWHKAIGYIWVILFFSWATPVWAYPLLRRNVGGIESFPLPFSIVGLFRR